MRALSQTIFNFLVLVSFALLIVANGAVADHVERSINTFISAHSAADGSSKIEMEILEECIKALPRPDQLEPIADAKSKYLKHIGGDANRNESVRTYTASVDLSYAIYQRQLIVITTSSIEKSEPVMKEFNRRFDRSAHFESNPENGDQWAGRNLVKEYYFSTEQGAIDDAMKRATAWLKQKNSIICKK